MSKKPKNKKSVLKIRQLVREFLDTTSRDNAPKVDLSDIFKSKPVEIPQDTGGKSTPDLQKAKSSLNLIYNKLQPKGALSGPALAKIQKAFKKNNL